ncbi:hypothetical protein Cni_G24612 [Canna indica]|uniref:Uncharacterized protein n=1 Tax=Canna indica TaxID=4628 RepID=A0AAQ3QK99_9LILI|nr:hypothetical protein Cni_G24612 [Canna indica]
MEASVNGNSNSNCPKRRAAKLVWKNCSIAGNPSLYKFSYEVFEQNFDRREVVLLVTELPQVCFIRSGASLEGGPAWSHEQDSLELMTSPWWEPPLLSWRSLFLPKCRRNRWLISLIDYLEMPMMPNRSRPCNLTFSEEDLKGAKALIPSLGY